MCFCCRYQDHKGEHSLCQLPGWWLPLLDNRCPPPWYPAVLLPLALPEIGSFYWALKIKASVLNVNTTVTVKSLLSVNHVCTQRLIIGGALWYKNLLSAHVYLKKLKHLKFCLGVTCCPSKSNLWTVYSSSLYETNYNGAILLWQVAPKSFSELGLYVLNEHVWIVLTSLCITVPLQTALFRYIYLNICSIATNEHHFTSISNLNINCISGLAIVKLNCLWLIHLKAITLRTRYNLVCESHQTRAQEERSYLLMKSQKP